MTRFLLIRHGHNHYVDIGVAGRLPEVHLDSKGREQAARLAERLSHLPIEAVYSSPLERARETAAPLAARLGLDVNLLDDLLEVDLGEWTGRRFVDLEKLTEWRLFNDFRCGTRAPGGEMMIEVQARTVRALEGLRRRHEGQVVAVTSHGDPIKMAIAYYAGIPIDLFARIEVSVASTSVLAIDERSARLLRLNDTGDILDAI